MHGFVSTLSMEKRRIKRINIRIDTIYLCTIPNNKCLARILVYNICNQPNMVGPTTKSLTTCEAIIVFFLDSSLYYYLYSCAIPIIAICWEYNLILIGVMLTICLVTNT